MTLTDTGSWLRLAPAIVMLVAGCGGSGGGGKLNPPLPPGPPVPTSVQTQQVFAGANLNRPTALLQAPNDPTRWFALNQIGIIRVFDNNPANAITSGFLDIRDRVSCCGEAGLLGIAFDPDFADNGEVYVSYTTAGSPLTSFISRFTSMDGNQTLDPNSEEIILTVFQDFENHNGGDIHFGPDGFLYIGFGDGGNADDPFNHAQDTTNLLGTFVRIDVNTPSGYLIPPTNPFANRAQFPCIQGFGNGNCPEIFAWGLRNPWRFSFDSGTGQLWTGDVGQGAWEEVNRINVGQNYGWKIREGAHCRPPTTGCATVGLVDPVTEYGHDDGQSITGGYVYRGSAIPGLQGQYVFGDFVSGRIWSVAADAPITTAPVELANTNHSISAFAEGVDGELYVIDYNGTIHQIVP